LPRRTVGAIWTACAPTSACGRSSTDSPRTEPTCLIASTAYQFGGRRTTVGDVVAELRPQLPTVKCTIVLGDSHVGDLTWADAVRRDQDTDLAHIDFADVDFAHPLWILFSSGTDGSAQGDVHSHGGSSSNTSSPWASVPTSVPVIGSTSTAPQLDGVGTGWSELSWWSDGGPVRRQSHLPGLAGQLAGRRGERCTAFRHGGGLPHRDRAGRGHTAADLDLFRAAERSSRQARRCRRAPGMGLRPVRRSGPAGPSTGGTDVCGSFIAGCRSCPSICGDSCRAGASAWRWTDVQTNRPTVAVPWGAGDHRSR